MITTTKQQNRFFIIIRCYLYGNVDKLSKYTVIKRAKHLILPKTPEKAFALMSML